MKGQDVFIYEGLRSPIGKFSGTLSSVRADDLMAEVLRSLANKCKTLDLAAVDEVLIGNANQAGEDNRNVARMALLLAGYPETVPGETINRLCASGLSAVSHAARLIACEEAALVIAGGVEHMTRAPYVLSKSSNPFGRDSELFDTSIGWRFVNPKMKEMFGTDSMGETAENVAQKFNISRADQDSFSLRSQEKAIKARSAGRFMCEITSIPIAQKKGDPIQFSEDEYIRSDSSIEALAGLKPAFRKDGSVTAGNSSGINDGAAALLLGSKEAGSSYGLKPIARIISSHAAGVEPKIMGMGPVPATNGVLKKADLSLKDINVIELNEAFAAQSLACIRELGLQDDDSRINPNGGAIALGHPLGMSGARLVLSAARELELQNARYALCTMCVGVGQGMAIIIERV